MSVVGSRSRCTYRKAMDEARDEYARARFATYIVFRGEGTGRRRVKKVIVGLAEPNSEQTVEDMVGRAGENAEPRECGKVGRKKCSHGF